MSKSIKASPPTFSVRTRPDGRIIKTRLTFDDANLVAILFNRFREDCNDVNQRAEVLREEDAIRLAGDGPIPLKPGSVRRNSLDSG